MIGDPGTILNLELLCVHESAVWRKNWKCGKHKFISVSMILAAVYAIVQVMHLKRGVKPTFSWLFLLNDHTREKQADNCLAGKT